MAPSTSRSSNSSPRVPAESSRTPSRENRPPLTNLPNLPNLNPQPSAYISPYAPITTRPQQSASQPTLPARSGINSSLGETHSVDFQTSSAAVSTYSSSSQHSLYSSPGPRQYAVLTPGMMSDPQSISQVSQAKKMYDLILLRPMMTRFIYGPRYGLKRTRALPPVRVYPSAICLSVRLKPHGTLHAQGLAYADDNYHRLTDIMFF